MTQVKCYAKKCEYNEYGICQLSCIELEESDLLWKDCGQSKERKDEPQTGEMMTEEEFDSMLARVLTGNNEQQTERSE